MTHADKELVSFLRRHQLYAPDIDRDRELDRLLLEMQKVGAMAQDTLAMQTEKLMKDREPAVIFPGRIKMIPAYIGTFKAPEKPAAVTVLDIGGTNVRCARVMILANGTCLVEDPISFLTPGVREETDTMGFYSEIALHIRDYLMSDQIGICFSLATLPTRDRDAVMAAGGKQIRVRDMIGKKVGESFRNALVQNGLPSHQQITVVNDTVAAALAGRSAAGKGLDTEEWADKDSFRSYIGFIYGTGTNLCFTRPSGEIINVESGAYCGFPAGDIDDRYNAQSLDPKEDRFEKMVSGGYQGGLMQLILETAENEGILSQGTMARIAAHSQNPASAVLVSQKQRPSDSRPSDSSTVRSSILTPADISAFSRKPDGDGRIAASCKTEQDRKRLAALFDAVTDRSACLCSITLSAAYIASGAGSAFITAEGSTYLKQVHFREMLHSHMEELAWARGYTSWKIQTVEDAILRGTAVACLSH